MIRRSLFAAALAALVLVASPALAQDCQVGQSLGSSLLIPYFEVDTTNPSGITTLFSVNNENSSETVVRVVLWTNWGIPTLGFDVYLAAWDSQSFNIRDLLNASLPSTGVGEDLSGFAFCTNPSFDPIFPSPAFSAGRRATLIAFHTGDADPTAGSPTQGLCADDVSFDSIARGYVTVDVVNECSGVQFDETFSPADSDFPYFSEAGHPAGIASISNRLWGDFFIVNPGEDFAQGALAVPLWADSGRFAAGELTFYGRFTGYDSVDNRVPLPDLWSTRFLNGGPFSGGTSLIVWRDVGMADAEPIPCNLVPSWWPMEESYFSARDEAGDNQVFQSDTSLFPNATQRFDIDDLPVPYSFGRVQFGLARGPGLSNPQPGWIQTVMSAEGRYSVGMSAIAINERCDDSP